MRKLGLARETVRRYLRAAQLDDQLTQAGGDRHPTQQDRPLGRLPSATLERRPRHHHRPAPGIRARGYTGGYGTLRAWLRPWQHEKPPPPSTPKPLKNRQIASWILRHPNSLTRHAAAQVRADCPHRLATHVAAFATMLIRRQGQHLDDWLNPVRADDLPHLRSFAIGLMHDYHAVVNSLTVEYSAGAVEHNVNRIKMLKNQTYGRAGFDPLRKRVLLNR